MEQSPKQEAPAEPQIVTSPSGEEFVFLPRRDFERLVEALNEAREDLDDIATYDRAMAEIANDPDAVLPADVTPFLLSGHRRLAAFRLWRGITSETLAVEAGITPAQLADVEASGNGVADPAVANRLASALDIPVSWIEP